jgi:hypothetical protein
MNDHTPESGDEISLSQYIDAIARYRRVILVATAGAAVLFAIGVLALYIRAPIERIATVQFRLLFEGAEDNKYPNDQPFNPTEIVSPPVVAGVFEANELERYGKLQDFQQALFIVQSNLALQQLDYSFQAKLADTRLTPVDRARLEEEFLRRREGVRGAEFSLSLRRSERLKSLPQPMMDKVLTDTLNVWATQADAHKGVARPDIDLVSRDVFARAANDDESPLIRIDVMRSGARRILAALTALERVPGSRAVRTEAQRSLSDEKAVVEDIMKFDLDPLMSLARASAGTGSERSILIAYVSNQLVTHQLNQKAAEQRAQNLQSSLREYMAQRGSRVEGGPAAPAAAGQPQAGQTATMPQIGDAFIDRLMEMTAAAQDEEQQYRQRLTDKYLLASDEAAASAREVGYYTDLQKQLSSPTIDLPRGSELLASRFKNTLEALNQSVDRVQKLYTEISIQTMNPARRLYTITQPVRLQTFTSMVWTRIALMFLFTLSVALLGATAAALVHDSYRRSHHRGAPPAAKPDSFVEEVRRLQAKL